MKQLKIPKFTSINRTISLFKKTVANFGSREIAIVKNPEYIYPPFDIYILAPKIKKPLKAIKGIITDMDGTTTTTETLCLHSLEWMIRKITGRENPKIWKGLNRKKDYPNIIGNSTTKHVEYLIKTYGKAIKEKNFKKAYLEAAIWTLAFGQDEERRKEVMDNINILGLSDLLKNKIFLTLIKNNPSKQKILKSVNLFLKKFSIAFNLKNFGNKVRAAIDIYYHRYHQILAAIAKGKGDKLSKELPIEKDKKLIEPMPGIGIYLALVKGWLGEDLKLFFEDFKDYLISCPRTNYTKNQLDNYRSFLGPLGKYFKKNPTKIGIVTSSIKYEANIVLTEVFRVIQNEIAGWPISSSKKEKLSKKFQNYENVYDCFVTASDSSEIRLKPHRDLYSIALYQLGLKPSCFKNVIGFEDSESGTIAIRAAGVGKCIAVPFSDTRGHDLRAASHCLYGGLPETILCYHCFLDLNKLKKFN